MEVTNFADIEEEFIRRVHAPPPLGYDPAPTFGGFAHPDYGLLRLTPWRIALVSFSALHIS